MQKPNPRGCCGNPWICLKCAQGQKSLKGLTRATHCTDRAQTFGIVTSTVEVCPPHPRFGRRCEHEEICPKKKINIYTYTYIYIYIYLTLYEYILTPPPDVWRGWCCERYRAMSADKKLLTMPVCFLFPTDLQKHTTQKTHPRITHDNQPSSGQLQTAIA